MAERSLVILSVDSNNHSLNPPEQYRSALNNAAQRRGQVVESADSSTGPLNNTLLFIVSNPYSLPEFSSHLLLSE
jgi:hypothetical protein